MNVINHEFRTADEIATETGFIIESIADALRNYPDTNSKRFACLAAADGKASFWVRTGFGNTASALLTDQANLTGDLETAIALAKLPRTSWTVYQQLEALIPLNRKAAEQMVEQYSMLGYMRDVKELARETHIICNGFKSRVN
ncbi:hypothetical protein CU102_12435 [Phyllobacterium brassicacearum]|uniref:Uncharacterized protein n=1 Tax=Phyllobacterium brassicacearum TaxID=314235 RepID=A0A2P7BQ52_9HYPH|nr:hypothetical protein [Phyllobacterium brassicacearum]PSH68565.1 hypothetical protein CU102_12435 [Phyllobacterium brassicacearum]TDQ19917.1 hypothetical protein DEV91_124112 [Phyllobacterium brassicacearum]